MIYDQSRQKENHYVSVNTLIRPKLKKHSEISASPAIEEQKEQVPSAGSPLAAMPIQESFSNHAISKPDVPAELEANRVSEEITSQSKYQPETNEGKKLLAHEQTHVVQQKESGSLHTNTIQRQTNKNEYTITSTQGNIIKVGSAVTYIFNGNIPEGADYTWVIENDPDTYEAFIKDNPGLLQRYTGNTNKREMKAIARIPGTHIIRVDITKGGQYISSTVYKQVVVSEHTPEHLQIMDQASKISVDSNVNEWTTMDLIKWKTSKDDKTLFDFKNQWVKGYNNVIKAAAKEYDLPEYLVAGVAYIEVGGDPLWIDDVAYNIRKNIPTGKKADLTSFGNISMQIGTAAETLRYNPGKITEVQREAIISSLKDARQNIFMATKHLSDLRNIDFKGMGAKQLTEDQVKVIGTRFNRGGGLSLQSIMNNLSYGEFIMKRKSLFEELLNDSINLGY
jgi:hypothetical protein